MEIHANLCVQAKSHTPNETAGALANIAKSSAKDAVSSMMAHLEQKVRLVKTLADYNRTSFLGLGEMQAMVDPSLGKRIARCITVALTIAGVFA